MTLGNGVDWLGLFSTLKMSKKEMREDLRRLVTTPPGWVDADRPRWSCVGAALSRGSGHSIRLCREFDMDPDEVSSVPEETRDWYCDSHLENGNYLCQCVTCDKIFIGHKRRVVCRICSTE